MDTMAVLRAPEMSSQVWMRNALLVAVLAEAGEAGAEADVPGARLDAARPRRRRASPGGAG